MREFETEIIQSLLSESGQPDFELPKSEEEIEIEYTAVGYFLSFKNSSIPKERVMLNKPNISGFLGGIHVGFVAFMENSEFTLECHAYEEGIPQGCRNHEFIQSAT